MGVRSKVEINTILLFSHLTFYKFFERFSYFHLLFWCLCVFLFILFHHPWRQVASSFSMHWYNTVAIPLFAIHCVYMGALNINLSIELKHVSKMNTTKCYCVWRKRKTPIFYWSLGKCLRRKSKLIHAFTLYPLLAFHIVSLVLFLSVCICLFICK